MYYPLGIGNVRISLTFSGANGSASLHLHQLFWTKNRQCRWQVGLRSDPDVGQVNMLPLIVVL